jgi:hypothetical protein
MKMLSHVVFSDEATFHISDCVNSHNVKILGTENPHTAVEHSRDSPKGIVFCALPNNKIYGPLFFVKETITGIVYLDVP